MKKVVLLFAVITSILLWSCGSSDSNKKNTAQKENQSQQKVEKKVPKLPEGYPAELTVPPGFRASQINQGSGSSSGAGGERTFKSYEIWKMNPQNALELINHYKKLMTNLGYEGEWTDNDVKKSARGVFTKENNELKLSISSDKFSFNLKIWDK